MKNSHLLKAIIYKLHLWIGIITGLIILTVCFTGSIYCFREQIEDLANHSKIDIEPQSSSYASIDSIVASLKKKALVPKFITLYNTPSKSIKVHYSNKGRNNFEALYINPFTGGIIGERSKKYSEFFNTTLSIHRSLLLNDAGKLIVGISISFFLFLLLSGLYMWWPQSTRQLKSGLSIKIKPQSYRFFFDLHNTLGFYSILPLLLISITGLYFSFPWVKDTILTISSTSTVTTEKTTQLTKYELRNLPYVSIDRLLSSTDSLLPYTAITTINFPSKWQPNYEIKKQNRNNYINVLLPDIIQFNHYGELSSVHKFTSQPFNKQIEEIILPIHMGKILGLPSLILYFFITIIGTSLPITGFILWYKKTKRKTIQ